MSNLQGTCPYIREEELERQLKDLILDVSLPKSWGRQWLAWLDRDELEERQKSEENTVKLQENLTQTDRKLNLLLDAYLDQTIESEIYKQKKNELFDYKIKVQQEIGQVKTQGAGWLEPMREFVNTSIQGSDLARAENNGEDLAIFARNVGSHYFLSNRQLTAEYKKGYFTLRASGGARSWSHLSPSHSLCVNVFNKIRTHFKSSC